MLRAAVLGSPVTHSLSPALHEAGYAALGLRDWSYGRHEITLGLLAGFLEALGPEWRGLSLTMPLKEEALALATTATDTARASGAVNTLVRREDLGWDGHNTDIHGVYAALVDVPHDGQATLLGSGATARSAVLALAGLGVRQLRLAVRGQVRPETLAVVNQCEMAVQVVTLAQWPEGPTDLVVSTLPPAAAPAAAEPLAGRSCPGTLLDVVYAGWPTPLAVAAADAGMTVRSGLEMLLHQAGEQFRLFTGHEAPLGAMRAAGERAMQP